MTQLERQIRTTQHRLWINRWLVGASRCLGGAAAVFAAFVVIQRSFAAEWPVLGIGVVLCAAGFLGSVVWTIARRDSAATAAAALDRAAGLRERLSSAQYCGSDADPFAEAVVADAERLSGSLSARRHIRLVMPSSLPSTMTIALIAALTFLVPVGWLASSEAAQRRDEKVQARKVRVAVKKQMDKVRKIVETTPVLADLQDELEAQDKDAAGRIRQPTDLRHEAIKKIDALADTIKNKRANGDYDKANDLRRMLRPLKSPKSPDASTRKLTRALAKGDFKTAKEEAEALKEQLATLKSDEDKELVEKMSKQLDDLAKQMEQLAKQDQLAKKLEQAGIKKEDVARVVESLKKNDLDQVKKLLQKKGLSPKQAEKLAKQLKRRMQSGGAAKKLAQAMKQGAKCNNPGQMGEAISGMSAAAQQLGDLEQLEQEMNQLDTAMAELKNAGDQMGQPGSGRNGTGKNGRRGRSGMGRRRGRGRGGIAEEENADVQFRTRRGKVHTGRGAIIGQFLVDGEQVKGETSSNFDEVVISAERDATDRINRNRIPRQYHNAIKAYFSTLRRTSHGDKPSAGRAKTLDGKADPDRP